MTTKTPAQSRPLSPFMLGQYYRFQLTMSRVGDHWLLSDLQGIS